MSQAVPAAGDPGIPSNKTFLGHPVGLYVLFFTEMWERFSYYGMRGLLKAYMVYYLFVTLRAPEYGCQDATNPCTLLPGSPTEVWGWSTLSSLLPTVPKEAASVVYGWYTGFVYFTPFFGGMLADRILGQRKTVVLGGILMAIGHFVMAFDNMFFLALFLLVLGNGAFKPNVSTQVGNLYKEGDPRRDGAFTIFYMGINLGAFICNFICGTLAALYGWHYGFGAAGVGMMIGLTVYLLGRRYLAPDNLAKRAANPTEQKKEPLTPGEWKRVYALVALCMLNIVFWAVYEQQGNTMQTWADEQTYWPKIGSFQIPANWFQSFNPMCIVLLAPILDIVWRWQARKGTEPTSVTKMAMGCIILGLSFIVMVVGAQVVGTGRGSMFWPLFCTLLLTVGELYLSPIGLSLVTKVSPLRIVSMMMGMWFLSSFFGNILSGYIGVLYTRWSHEAFFLLLTGLGVSAGLGIFAFNRPLKAVIGNK